MLSQRTTVTDNVPGPPPPPPYQQQPPQYYQPQYQNPYWPPPPNPGTNGLAIAAMVLGIIWIYWIGSILAIIFGHIALGQIKRTGQSGRGMAIAGVVLGYVGLGTLLFFMAIGFASSMSGSG